MATYYISTSGLTTNNGTTNTTPWPISKFTSVAFVAGDIILFKKGDSFTGNYTFAKSGSSGNNITIDAYGSGNNPEFNGNGGTTAALALNGSSYLTVNNIVVKNTGLTCEAPFQIYNCHDVLVYNCFAGYGKRGIRVFNTTGNIVISHCWFSNFSSPDSTNTIVGNGGGSGIQWDSCSGSGNKTIYSKFYTVIGAGTNPTPGVGDVISHYKCNFGTADVFAGVGSFGYEAAYNQVRGGGSSAPGYAGTVGGDVGGSNQYIHDNTFINSGKVGAQVQGGTNINMSNNIIANDTFTWIATSGPNPSVGIAFGNYSSLPVSNIVIGGNKVCFKKSGGSIYNKWWDSGAKTYPAFQPTNWTTNTADSTCDAAAHTNLLPDPLFNYGDWNSVTNTLTFPTIPAKTYGNSNFSGGATTTTTNTINYTSDNTAVATIVSGSIHIVAPGTANITATDSVTTVSQPLVVNKANLTITAANQSKNYGSANPSLTYTFTGFVNGDTTIDSNPSISTSAITSSGAGTYPIALSGGSSTKYNLTLINGTLTVNKVTLTITANSFSRLYGAANPSFTVGYSGFVNSDTSSNLTTQATATSTAILTSNVGSYSIVPSGASSSNYNFTYVNGTLTITQASLTITCNNLAKVQGAVNPTLTVSYSGFLNGDTNSNLSVQPTIVTTAVTGSAVGTYPITASGAVGINYSISYVAGILTVNSSGITFPSLPTKTYGNGDFAPGATSANSITYSSSNTAVATIVANNIHIVGAGSSTITANDGFTTANQPLTVNKATLTATADNHTIFVGSSIPTLSIAYNGFVNGDTISSITVPTASTSATGSSPVGVYTITVSGGTSSNYSFNLVNGTLYIISSSIIHINIPVILLT